jgi:hypothetical protein
MPMAMIRRLGIAAAMMILLLGLGCRGKGPTPKEGAASGAPAPVGSTETGGAHPATGSQDPHAGLAMDALGGGSASSGQPDASGMIEVGGLAFKLPDQWKAEAPRSAMRRAQLVASGSGGPAELIVYFFGPEGAGGAKANVERWVGQFTKADGSAVTDAKQTSMKVGGLDVIKVDVEGEYGGGMGAPGQGQPTKSNQRLLAAIVNSGGGPYYFKFLGPAETIKAQSKAFDGLLESIVAR